jgi:putative ABC transport system substrate-binding protein
MRRRDFTRLLGGATVAWSVAAHAQPTERVRRIGVLTFSAESDPEGQSSVAAFREELGKLGWIEGRNIEIKIRWAAADLESMKRFAKELVALQPDLILTSSTPAAAAMLQATRSIPIVFVIVADPVGSGFVASLPRPGGNATGFTPLVRSLGGKWVELLKEMAPRLAGSCYCTIRRRQLSSKVLWARSNPPQPGLARRRSSDLPTTCRASNPLLPQRHASRTAASS